MIREGTLNRIKNDREEYVLVSKSYIEKLVDRVNTFDKCLSRLNKLYSKEVEKRKETDRVYKLLIKYFRRCAGFDEKSGLEASLMLSEVCSNGLDRT
jgi:hypothetical protein